VREELNKLGGSIAVHRNPLATINAVLNRLVEQGRLKETVKDGRKAWQREPIHKLADGAKFRTPGELRRRAREIYESGKK
jgi:hypothetical protein